ncbi:MAG: hypothetical protein K6G54_06035, partial [Oscillospiraceae bacterium]|nr:hypothetical protein [Oscillospiraceae bacterium]
MPPLRRRWRRWQGVPPRPPGAPKAVQTAKDNGQAVYSVGYNIDMLAAAPTAALTSSTNDW